MSVIEHDKDYYAWTLQQAEFLNDDQRVPGRHGRRGI